MPGVTDIVSAVIPCLGEEDAIGAVVDHKTAVRLDAPATPERVLAAIDRVKSNLSS